MEAVIKKGAVNELEALCQKYSEVLYVADKNTYAAFGRIIKDILIFDVPLIPNEASIAKLSAAVGESTQLIVGIGSGVINDLCKYVSFKYNIPYFIFATAPSMDGYASGVAAMIINDMKITYQAHTPEVIIADTDILKNAPMDMICAGYGDVVGKFSALNDWELSHLVTGEKIDYEIYDEVESAINKVTALRYDLIKRSEESIYALMDALVMVGNAMKKAGNSRPASGSEHHLSHFFEITGLIDNTPYLPHGIDVAYSTVITARLRENLLSGYKKPIFEKAFWIERVKEIYKKAADGVIKLQSELKFHEMNINTPWAEIERVLKKHPSADEIYSLIQPVGYEMNDFIKLYGEKRITDAVYYAKDLKDRYTMLWLIEESHI